MSLAGLRIHFAGSASALADADLLRLSHEFVSKFAALVIGSGGGFVLGAGSEPVNSSGQPCIFDWTILETISTSPAQEQAWPTGRPGRFHVVASQRGLDNIPTPRQATWQTCLARADFDLESITTGWRMGGEIRSKQLALGDILVTLGGGAGVEHLAELYSFEGRPVLPIRAELGAYSNDGNGGSSYLHARALANVSEFFALKENSGSAAGRLSRLVLDTTSDPATVAADTQKILDDLLPRLAFYIRLQDEADADFEAVEEFFRGVVDPILAGSFTPYELGRTRPESAFMNVEIFERIATAGLVVADLTGVRPNCMMELGFALGRGRKVVVSAKKDTRLPFDEDKLPTFFWDAASPKDELASQFMSWMDIHVDMPPIVSVTAT